MSSTPTRAEIIAEARTWVGTPFSHQGRLKGVRVDCVGVVYGTGKTFGLLSNDFTNYGRLPVPSVMEPLLDAHLDRVARGGERAGDIAWLSDPWRGGAPRHLAIFAGATLIHANNWFGKCVEHQFDDRYRRAVRRWYSYRGVGD